MADPAVGRPIDVRSSLDATDAALVSDLVDAASRTDDHRALSEQKALDLHRTDAGALSLLARGEDGGPLPGYAQLSPTPAGGGTWGLEIVVHPTARRAGNLLFGQLLSAALGEVSRRGGGHVTLWVPKPTTDHDAAAGAAGLVAGRDLLQMRRPLPVPGDPPGLRTRPFRPGEDEAAWLAVNNRAFAHHPEQGGWDLETLLAREQEPWFDPEGFLLLEIDGRLAGSCWTKVHRDTEPLLGEIYVISTDPDFHGRGLGRSLCLAGLHWLATAGGAPTGMLYVDADNAPAVGLYRALDFAVDHVDRAYTGTVPAAPDGT